MRAAVKEALPNTSETINEQGKKTGSIGIMTNGIEP
jgi:hypothetical protein